MSYRPIIDLSMYHVNRLTRIDFSALKDVNVSRHVVTPRSRPSEAARQATRQHALRIAASALLSGRRDGRSPASTAHETVQRVIEKVGPESPALAKTAIRQATRTLLRPAAHLDSGLGPQAVAVALGAIEVADRTELSAERALRVAVRGAFDVAGAAGPSAEIVLTGALLSAAALRPDWIRQVIHDIRSEHLQ